MAYGRDCYKRFLKNEVGAYCPHEYVRDEAYRIALSLAVCCYSFTMATTSPIFASFIKPVV